MLPKILTHFSPLTERWKLGFLIFWGGGNMERLKEYSVSIMGLKVEGISTENTDNVCKALIILLNNNPQIFEDKKTPEEILQALDFNFHETKKTKTGRWAQAAKRLSEEHPITPEIDAVLQKGIEEFRAGFSLGAFDLNQPET